MSNPWRVLVEIEKIWPGVKITDVRTAPADAEPAEFVSLEERLLRSAVDQVIDLSETVRVLRLALEKVSRDIGSVPDTSIQLYIKKTMETVKKQMGEK